MDASTLQTVVAGVVLAAILWLVRSVNDYGKTLTQLQTILTGADGHNGLNGEVKGLRDRVHRHGDAIHAIHGKHDLLEQRVDTIEGRLA